MLWRCNSLKISILVKIVMDHRHLFFIGLLMCLYVVHVLMMHETQAQEIIALLLFEF